MYVLGSLSQKFPSMKDVNLEPNEFLKGLLDEIQVYNYMNQAYRFKGVPGFAEQGWWYSSLPLNSKLLAT